MLLLVAVWQNCKQGFKKEYIYFSCYVKWQFISFSHTQRTEADFFQPEHCKLVVAWNANSSAENPMFRLSKMLTFQTKFALLIAHKYQPWSLRLKCIWRKTKVTTDIRKVFDGKTKQNKHQQNPPPKQTKDKRKREKKGKRKLKQVAFFINVLLVFFYPYTVTI